MQLDMVTVYQQVGEQPAQILQQQAAEVSVSDAPDTQALRKAASGLVWTQSMRRMYTLVNRCGPFCCHMS